MEKRLDTHFRCNRMTYRNSVKDFFGRYAVAQLASRITALAILLGVIFAQPVAAQDEETEKQTKILPHAHSHNDYEHARPLLDALDHGFGSIEADVFLVDGELLVAHWLYQTSKDRTLESLSLKPLFERFQRYNGSVYPEPAHITLLVDIKQDGVAAYRELYRQLERYAPMISSTQDGKHTRRGVTVVVSGDRAIDEISASNPRYVGIDGRLGDLESEHPADLIPLISDNWRSHFQWRGEKPLPEDEKEKLTAIVQKAHQKGRRVRFWGTPESEQLWEELVEAQVDLIGTDDLKRLKKFFSK